MALGQNQPKVISRGLPDRRLPISDLHAMTDAATLKARTDGLSQARTRYACFSLAWCDPGHLRDHVYGPDRRVPVEDSRAKVRYTHFRFRTTSATAGSADFFTALHGAREYRGHARNALSSGVFFAMPDHSKRSSRARVHRRGDRRPVCWLLRRAWTSPPNQPLPSGRNRK